MGVVGYPEIGRLALSPLWEEACSRLFVENVASMLAPTRSIAWLRQADNFGQTLAERSRRRKRRKPNMPSAATTGRIVPTSGTTCPSIMSALPT